MNLRNIITNLFSPVQVVSAPAPPSYDAGVLDTSADAAMKVSAVYSAVKLISEGIARLSLSYQRYNFAASRFVDDYNATLYRVLRIKPNATMSSFDMWRAAVQQMLLEGNAYLLPKYDALGDVVSLTLLSPYSTVYDAKNNLYMIRDAVNGIARDVAPAKIVHLRNIGTDGGHTGLSTIQLAARALGIMRLSDQNTANTLSNGGRMRGILTGAGGVDTFGAATTSQLSGVADGIEKDMREGRTVIPVPQDMKFQSITLSPADAKVLESKQVTTRDIARFFRVHPDLLYEGSNNTYKAAEVPNVMFLTQTLAPLLVQIESELLIKLVPENLWGKRRIRFDREDLYTTDLLTEGTYFEKMLQTGIYTVNELRRKKGQSPVEGGDTPLVSANLKGLDVLLSEFKNTRENE